jgi:hypothetical protein
VSEKTWNFIVVATSLSGQTKFFGSGVNNYEDALTLQKNAIAIGWHTVTIYDASLAKSGLPSAKEKGRTLLVQPTFDGL